ncbi:MAG: methyltransferase domain-containing protein [Alphaproteobacteria bacterium]|nr:methyltransferase domain-containing protein [Alphaproteobacteria bacterium]
MNSSLLFDRVQLARNRRRAALNRESYDFLPRKILEQLVERIGEVRRQFPTVLNLGGGRVFAEFLPAGPSSPFGVAERIDCELVTARLAHDSPLTLVASEDQLPFAAASFDLVVAPLCLHWLNDLPGCLMQIHHCLKPDGLFLAAIWGGESLEALRQAWLTAELELTGGVCARIAPMADGEALAGLLQRARFALPMVDRDDFVLSYDHPLHLMRELRGMGEGNCLTARSRKFVSRELLSRVCDSYPRLPNGRITAQFSCFFLTGWAVADSQPKALARGSGQIDLRQALGAGYRPE